MIIACDTSSVICSVAVVSNGTSLWETQAEGGQIHIEKLSPFLQSAMEYCTQRGKAPSALAIAIGPGSFNGLRIGLATMKALATAINLPLIPVPTMDAMALGMRDRLTGVSRAVIYSHRNFVHFANYHLSEEGSIVTPRFEYGPWDLLYEEDINHYFGKSDRGFETWLGAEAPDDLRAKFIQVDSQASLVGRLAELRPEGGSDQLDALEPLYNAVYEAKKWVPPQF